ncbi:MAG: DNA polymerase III subunit beta [Dehalococcoidia bacterium]|nr:DNA polymerase III subunit beta [Dehalococcoidia bacterium]
MRLSCLQENMSKGLATVGRAVAARTTLPITNNILLSTDQSRLRLAATNLEIAISCWIGAKVEEEGSITIPARLLTEFVNSLPNERIDLVLTPQSHAVRLKCARFEARIAGMDANDFPPIPTISEGITKKIEAEALRNAITQTVLAAAVDDARPVLTGACIEFEDNKVTLAAADGFRLAVYHLPLTEPVPEKMSVIIPARTLQELNRLLADQDDPVEMTVSSEKRQVLFRLKNVEMVSQLIQGNFPNYGQLIPQSYATRAVVSVSDFLRATKSASVFARDGSGILRIQVTPGTDLTPGKMSVSARAEEIGDNTAEIDATVKGDASKIAFNSKYLIDVLSVLGDGQVALETTSPSSPGVLRIVGSDNYIHVVMPMFVQW